MNFGERLKQLRQERNWSQPELAEAIGIEQSYLSKLENDKSAPSADMLNRILEAFDVDIDTALEGIDESEVRKHLRSIPLVNGHLQAQKESARSKRNRWIVASSLLCVLGITTIVMGISYMVSPRVIYEYESAEIVPTGNNGETFQSLNAFIDHEFAPMHAQMIREETSDAIINSNYETLRQSYASLSTPEFQFSYEYRGNSFIEPLLETQGLINLEATSRTNGGTRTFELYNTRSESRTEAADLNMGGAFLLALGIFGFITERKLFPKSS